MRSDLQYKMYVEQPVEAAMEVVVEDASHFGITREEVMRAAFNWALKQIQAGEIPEWFFKDLNTE